MHPILLAAAALAYLAYRQRGTRSALAPLGNAVGSIFGTRAPGTLTSTSLATRGGFASGAQPPSTVNNPLPPLSSGDLLTQGQAVQLTQSYAQRFLGRTLTDAELAGLATQFGYSGNGPVSRTALTAFLDAQARALQPPAPVALPPTVTSGSAPSTAGAPLGADSLTLTDAVALVQDYALRYLGRYLSDAEVQQLGAEFGYAGSGPISRAALTAFLNAKVQSLTSGGAASPAPIPLATPTPAYAPPVDPDLISESSAVALTQSFALQTIGRTLTDGELQQLAGELGYSGGAISERRLVAFLQAKAAALGSGVPQPAPAQPAPGGAPAAPPLPAPSGPSDLISQDQAVAIVQGMALQYLGRALTGAELDTLAAQMGYTGGPVSEGALRAFLAQQVAQLGL